MSAERPTPTAAEWYKIINTIEPGAMQRLFDEFFTREAFVQTSREWRWSHAGTRDLADGLCESPIAQTINRTYSELGWAKYFGEKEDFLFDLDTRVCRFVQAWYL